MGEQEMLCAVLLSIESCFLCFNYSIDIYKRRTDCKSALSGGFISSDGGRGIVPPLATN